MDNQNIKHVAIVGGGISAWMSAAFLAHMLGESVAITLVETPQGDAACFSQSTLPTIKAFLGALGLSEGHFLAKTQASIKLGTQFVNWGHLGNRFFHPHGNYGAEFDVVALHQWWLTEKSINPLTPDLDQLSMAAALATQGRFSHPVPDRRMIQSTYDYAYHIDGAAFVGILKELMLAGRTTHVVTKALAVALGGETGAIEHIVPDDGQIIQADFYLDCTGLSSLLLGAALKTEFEDWSCYLPCDRAVWVNSPRASEFSPFSRSIARDAGWQWRHPLQNQTGSGYVYGSQFCSDDDATSVLLENLDGRTLGDPEITAFKNGRYTASFVKNVVAIGEASGFLEPLEATALHLVQSSLTRLLALWPTRAFDLVVVDEYNQVTAREWELARDFLALHYHLSTRSDSPFWRHCNELAIPDGLTRRLEHWRAGGRLISPGPEPFQPPSWLSVLVGQGGLPANHDPLVEARSDKVDFAARLAGLRTIIAESTASMPTHAAWLEKNGRARPV
jgi:tryptophan 7-halogenase